MQNKAIIIGAGIGGIATAIRLRHLGYQVEVFEANGYPGGKLSEIRNGGFRFDAGPSLFTMPQYVDELFQLMGEAPSEHFRYRRLEDICHYFWEDGTRLTAFADKAKFQQEIQGKLGVPPAVLDKALRDSQRKYELTGRIFLERPLHRWRTWFSADVAKAMTRIPQLDIFSSMHQVNRRLLQHPKLVQFFDRFATYNGSNPYKAPGILNIIPHFEHHFGAYFPERGMVSITESLVALAQRHGVAFRMGCPVREIMVENGEAVGIITRKGEKHKAGLVVSNMDIHPTYKKLLPQQKHPQRILRSERSSSALIFYWGIQGAFPELGLHNILFSEDYQREFDVMAQGQVDADPTIYIHISSKELPTDAPAGMENWFTMINVPHNQGQDWDGIIQEARKNIIRKASRMLGRDIAPLIASEDILDPRGIEARTSSFAGALYGTASNDRMAAFRRHANFSSRIRNLYFCGGSVHPGGGIPLSLLSAKIVGELVAGEKQNHA